MADGNDTKRRIAALSPTRRALFNQRWHDLQISAPPAPPDALPRRRAPSVERRAVDLGLFFFSSAAPSHDPRKYDLIFHCVEIADREGLHSVWMPERHFDEFGSLFPNPAVLAAAIAMTTRRIYIRAGSVSIALHDPLRVVEEWSVVDNLSGGRVGLSLASGWHPDDFVLAPEAYAERKARAETAARTIRDLWRGEPIRRRNGVGREIDVLPQPRPIQREVPLWLTVVRGGGFDHAARLGLNVLTGLVELDVDELAEHTARYRAAHVAGSPPRVTVMVHAHVHPEPGHAREIARGPLSAYLHSFLRGSRRPLLDRADVASAVTGLTAGDEEAILAHITERYLSTRSLIGTPQDAATLVRRLVGAGVDEIACLVDFGLPAAQVIAGLEHLLRARDLVAAGKASP